MWFCLERLIDNTIDYVKNGSIDVILSKLNSFHPNIQFTYEEEEKKNKLPSLDVLVIRNGNFIETEVYGKHQITTFITTLYINKTPGI